MFCSGNSSRGRQKQLSVETVDVSFLTSIFILFRNGFPHLFKQISLNMVSDQLKLARKYLKLKIAEDNTTLRGLSQQRLHLRYLLTKTIENGESHSAVIVGPKGGGKSTLVNSVLSELGERPHFEEDVIVVKLCGLLHGDDKIALHSITSQMGLDNVVGDRVFGSFSENFTYLLNCLKSGENRSCRSLIFIMDDFHLFCHTNSSQTLLYSLFDVSHNQNAPICIIGVTCRLNFMDLLEKRIKSRFSQRHIFVFPDEDESALDGSKSGTSPEKRKPLDGRLELFVRLLTLPKQKTGFVKSQSNKHKTNQKSKKAIKGADISTMLDDEFVCDGNGRSEIAVPPHILERCNVTDDFDAMDPLFVKLWNDHILSLAEDRSVIEALHRQYYYTINERSFRDVLFRIICKISQSHPHIETADIQIAINKAIDLNGKVFLIQSISVLELSLLIAMKHQTQIFDGQPMNFEMIFNRYTKFVNSNSSSQSVPKAVVLKAFEHLRDLELIGPFKSGATSSGHSRIQKEYQLFVLKVTEDEINEGIRSYKNLPTEICQWVLNSTV